MGDDFDVHRAMNCLIAERRKMNGSASNAMKMPMMICPSVSDTESKSGTSMTIATAGISTPRKITALGRK
jgi:hypothetical protein